MSSFDKTAGKNLDEILASIRKTLADESPHPDANAGELNSAAQAKAPGSVNHNGSKAPAGKIDEDLADLLAGGLGISAPAPKDTPRTADQKDPLWFLRPSGERESQVLPLPADRVSPSIEALMDSPANPAPERSSLAPVFVADNGSGNGQPSPAATGLPSPPAQGNAAAPAAASAPIETKPAAKASPQDAAAPANAPKDVAGSSPLPEVVGRSATVKAPAPAPTAAAPKADLAKPGVMASAPAVIGPAAAPLKPPGATQPQATATAPNPVRLAEPAKPAAAAAGASLRATLGNSVGSPTKSASAIPRPAALNGAASTATPPAAASLPDAARPTMVPTAQTQALEQIIEQLLEPLLRRWVEANLPRLVDAAIRAEVARALDTKHLNGQDADRKV
jgi:cell pole-organizing protein PopZ